MGEWVCPLEGMGLSGFWTDRPVLVTGATGLVGGWVLRRLLEEDADVVCLVRDWVPGSELLTSGMIDRVVTVRGDLCDQPLLERALGEYEIDTVFHLAAQTIVPIANRNPVSTFESNIRGTWSLLEAVRRSPNVKQAVVASSDKAYGSAEELPYTEKTPLEGRYPYDVSKSCADLLAQSYACTWNTPVVISRCGNFYGGGDLNWNRIVPGTVRAGIRGRSPVIRSDGTPVRDYFYVEDGAAAYLLLAEKLADDRDLIGEAFNFSNEEQVSVLEMAERILNTMGVDLEPVVEGGASREIDHQYLDASRASRVLGWKPLFSLEQGLDRTIQWYRNWFEERQS